MRGGLKKDLDKLFWPLLCFCVSLWFLYDGYRSYRDYGDWGTAGMSVAAATVIGAMGVRGLWVAGRVRSLSGSEQLKEERNSAVIGCLLVALFSVPFVYTFTGSSSLVEAWPLLLLAIGIVIVCLLGAAVIWFGTRRMQADAGHDYEWSHLFQRVIEHLERFADNPGKGPDHDAAVRELTMEREMMRLECKRILGGLDTTQPKDRSTAAGINAARDLVEGWCDEVLELKRP